MIKASSYIVWKGIVGMSKIAIVGVHNLHLMQFLYKYTDILDSRGISYDVLYWDRDMDSSIKYKTFSGNKIAYRYKMSNYQPKWKKVKGFIGCIKFFCKIIRDKKYDHIILLTTQTALPVYILSKTIRNSKYIFDYRDLTYEQNSICKKIIKKLITESQFTAISSMGFKKVLGESNKFVVSHNVSNLKMEFLPKQQNQNIRIVFWGMIRQVEWNKKICDVFGNVSGIELVYRGEGHTEELKEYCEKYQNITFTGRYTTDQISSFAEQTDVLLNLYANDAQQKLAMTVKLYDAIRYGLPMLISKGSYMAEIMETNKYAYITDIDNFDFEKFIKWYQSLNLKSYPYEKEYIEIKDDDQYFEQRLLQFIKE